MKEPAICGLRLVILAFMLTGCITHPQNPAATQPSTIAINPATTQPSYWLDQAPTASVRSADFQKLWSACEDVARDYFMKIDRQDFRDGLLTTVPTTSAQWFEPWRPDVRSFHDSVEASIATIRRSIRFEFSREADDTWSVSPKVLVERQSIAGERVSAVVQYARVFSGPQRSAGRIAPGSSEADAGIILPARYWYPVRRDAKLEGLVAADVEKKLRHR